MDIVFKASSGSFNGTFKRLLQIILLVSIFVFLALYILTLPLGVELFFFRELSSVYSPSYLIQVGLFNFWTGISLGQVFVFCVLVYFFCFALAWRQKGNLHAHIKGFLSKPISLPLKSFLFALPVLSCLTYIAVLGIHVLEESYGIPIGKPPLPEDTLLAYYGLTISPLTEEITYRILPIGVFLAVRLLIMSKGNVSLAYWKRRLSICFWSFVSPEGAKKMVFLESKVACLM